MRRLLHTRGLLWICVILMLFVAEENSTVFISFFLTRFFPFLTFFTSFPTSLPFMSFPLLLPAFVSHFSLLFPIPPFLRSFSLPSLLFSSYYPTLPSPHLFHLPVLSPSLITSPCSSLSLSFHLFHLSHISHPSRSSFDSFSSFNYTPFSSPTSPFHPFSLTFPLILFLLVIPSFLIPHYFSS